jgi:hypothetical protein
LGARLIIQRAVEDEFDAWLGRARYERRPEHERGLRNFGDGYRNGYRVIRARHIYAARNQSERPRPPHADASLIETNVPARWESHNEGRWQAAS